MSRPSFESIYMTFALSLEKRSTCERKQVGCVVASEDYQHVLGIGYNGNIPGGSNHCENPNAASNCGCEHAESNALLKVAASSNLPKVLFTTWSPCRSCAKKILIKQGIKKVYYCRRYKDLSSLDLLHQNGIATEQIGQTMTAYTKDKGLVDYAPGDEIHFSLDVEQLHRVDGPALIQKGITHPSHYYYLDGIVYQKEEYEQILEEVKNMSTELRLTDPRWWVREFK